MAVDAGVSGVNPQPVPYFREAGEGPGVVCLHSNASTSGQWRALMQALAPSFHVLAADSYGAGRSPAWPRQGSVSLSDEVALLEPVFSRAGEPHALVGHSYGAAVALAAALAQPHRVRALALYEPTMFCLLDEERAPPNEADGIRGAVARSAAALDSGDEDGAAESFIDFWMGTGNWSRMPEARKGPIREAVRNVRGWAQVLLGERTTLHAFRTLDVPVLYMVGGRSPASSRGVARLLTAALPRVTVLEFPDLGHMAPVTHPDPVNDAIVRFLEQN